MQNIMAYYTRNYYGLRFYITEICYNWKQYVCSKNVHTKTENDDNK